MRRAILEWLGSVKSSTIKRIGLGLVWVKRVIGTYGTFFIWYTLIGARHVGEAWALLLGLVWIALYTCWWWSSAHERDFEG